MEDAYNIGQWAIATLVTHRLLHPELFKNEQTSHPSLLIQSLTDEVFRPFSPKEVFSDQRPVFVSESSEQEGWVPIDILLGKYIVSEQKIEIYVKNIQHFAHRSFNCEPEDLELIVRFHEYGHAIVHLGLPLHADRESLTNYPPGKETNWETFLSSRTTSFQAIDNAGHEFIAQLLTWLSIEDLEPPDKVKRFQNLFEAVMAKQPPEYRLSDEILERATAGNLKVLMAWLREREGPSVPEGSDLSLAAQSLFLCAAHGSAAT